MYNYCKKGLVIILDLNILANKLDELQNRYEASVSLYVVEKLHNGNLLENYAAFKPSLSVPLQNEIIDIITPFFIKLINIQQVEYNENGRTNDVIEYCLQEYIGDFYNKLLESLKDDNCLDELNKETRKDFYCIKFNFGPDDEMIIVNRISQMKKLSKGLKGYIADKTFRKTSEIFIGIEPTFDLIIYKGEIVIVNNISLQRIFDLKSKYIENANNVLNQFESAGKIEGFDLFREDSIEDGNVVKRISRLLQKPERMTRFIENFNKVGSIIEEFELNILLNEEKTKIVYTEKKQLNDIVKLLNDAYYKTVLSGEKGRDDLR